LNDADQDARDRADLSKVLVEIRSVVRGAVLYLPHAGSRFVRQLRLGHRWIQSNAGVAHVFAWTIARDEPHPINAPFTIERSATDT